jgi:CheY-like chemotaxis protein
MAQSASHSGCKERSVLIVDDEEPNRQLLAAVLGARGYATITARDGPAALEIVRQGGVDLMLLDVMMPGMDGVEVCQRIRGELRERELTIVFVTALSDRESRMRAKLAGADDFLVKPIESFELMFRVENWMKLRSIHELEQRSSELTLQMQHLESAALTLASQIGDVAAACCEAARAGGMSSMDLRSVNDQLIYCAERLAHFGELETSLDAPRSGSAATGTASAQSSLASSGKPGNQRT